VTDAALLEKAGRALAAARAACERGDTETASDRAYYAVYYAAWALLVRTGVPRPKIHNGMIAEFSRSYVKTGRVAAELGATLSRLQGLRLVADYTLDAIPARDAARALDEAERFIAAASDLIGD
jgi:uncharacterized protein (UPF0332 family)